MIDNLSIATHDFPLRMFTSFSVDDILLPRYVNWSTTAENGDVSFLFKTHELSFICVHEKVNNASLFA